MKRFFLTPTLALLTALAFVGCSDDKKEPVDPRVPATEVVLDVVEKDLAPGETLQLRAAAKPLDTTDKVVWSSDNETVATVSTEGLVKAESVGQATIKALCGSVSATCVVRVAESGTDPVEPTEEYDIISFETDEGMKDINGADVTLGDAEVVGGFAAGTYHDIFWAKPYAADYGQEEEYMGLTVDLPLFSTADGNVWFGSYYNDGSGWGTQMDTWGGFALSRNFNTTAAAFNYADQFSAYASEGASASRTFAVAYCNGMMGGTYANPTIEFAVTPRRVAYLCLAPSTMLYTYYKYDSSAVSDRTFGYRITGSLKGDETGHVDVMLVNMSSVAEGWVKADLTSLGEVDRLVFKPQGVNPNKDLDPVYFCLDEIALVK